MAPRRELLAFGCREDDLAVLRRASGPEGPVVRSVKSTAEFAHDALSRGPLAIILGVGERSLGNLDLISVIRAIRSELPVIVIAEEDSLEVERRVRQESIFYYLVHPVDRAEVGAVLNDLLRRERS
jgi:DNA-binding response OmpR family regulator